jgi:hypothetical protein
MCFYERKCLFLEVTSLFSSLTGKFRPDALVSFNRLSKVNYDGVYLSSSHHRLLSLSDMRRKTSSWQSARRLSVRQEQNTVSI